MRKSKTVFIALCFLILMMPAFSQNEIKTYNDSLGFYSFNYPADFEIKKLAPAAVMVTSALSSPDDKFQETLYVMVSKVPEGITIDSLASILVINMQRQYLVLKDLRKEKISISGYDGRKISSTVMDKQMVSVSESFALIKGLLIRLSYRNEYQTNSNETASFNELIRTLKTNW
jgi:hypothetical protein